jgi:hypothetical protein
MPIYRANSLERGCFHFFVILRFVRPDASAGCIDLVRFDPTKESLDGPFTFLAFEV